jgi:hypothetical protein
MGPAKKTASSRPVSIINLGKVVRIGGTKVRGPSPGESARCMAWLARAKMLPGWAGLGLFDNERASCELLHLDETQISIAGYRF